ncbi:MAG: hypothetical protein EXR62_18160 [Chloroflexi bacterium]|nr:hypothetical protein [Chloroflexota bacterium]
MASIRIWALESDNDAKACGVLAKNLIAFLGLRELSIRTAGKSAIPRSTGRRPADDLKKAVANYLIQDDHLIFVIDRDGVMSFHKRRQEPNSLINQVQEVLQDTRFTGRVHLALAVQEVEAWFLIDCLGVLCYFAGKYKTYQEDCRAKIRAKSDLRNLVNNYQRGDTELIVEPNMGGGGVKEYLEGFSREIFRTLNPDMRPDNINREKYRETMSPDICRFVEINNETLRRNASLNYFGNLLAACYEQSS